MTNAAGTKPCEGLTQVEAVARLQFEGYNELPAAKPRNLRAITLDVIREPMFILLMAGGIIYLMFGDVSEALVLLLSIFVIVAITTYQERKTERALEALRDLASPRAATIDWVLDRFAKISPMLPRTTQANATARASVSAQNSL